MHQFQKLSFLRIQDIFRDQCPVEHIPEHRVIGTLGVNKNAAQALLFLAASKSFEKQSKVDVCSHASHKPGLVDIEFVGEVAR